MPTQPLVLICWYLIAMILIIGFPIFKEDAWRKSFTGKKIKCGDTYNLIQMLFDPK